MTIIDLVSSIQSVAPELSSSYCIVNGALMRLDEIEKMGISRVLAAFKAEYAEKVL